MGRGGGGHDRQSGLLAKEHEIPVFEEEGEAKTGNAGPELKKEGGAQGAHPSGANGSLLPRTILTDTPSSCCCCLVNQ